MDDRTILGLVAVVAAAVTLAWVLRRVAPGMRPLRRLVWIVVGSVLLGGFFYGAMLVR
ncbi:MAG TPA: hypothetical protein VGR21_04050 [Cryptosporangiaceae bacterium]|nr:hypothetical protein [Cryptosporangiaceae bacterium]